MSTQLFITRSNNGYPTSGSLTCYRFSDTNQQFELAANTVTTITAPTGTTTQLAALFSYTPDASVWVLPAATPTLVLPTTTVTFIGSVLNPIMREVYAGQSIQLLTSQANVFVSVSFYEIIK